MKIIPAIFFVAAGIWIAFNYPTLAQQAYVYIEQVILWAAKLINDVMNK